MKYYVKGIQDVDYTSKSGNAIKGKSYHCNYETKNVDGEAVEKIFISDKMESPLIQIGDTIDVFYNKWGSVDMLMLVE